MTKLIEKVRNKNQENENKCEKKRFQFYNDPLGLFGAKTVQKTIYISASPAIKLIVDCSEGFQPSVEE